MIGTLFTAAVGAAAGVQGGPIGRPIANGGSTRGDYVYVSDYTFGTVAVVDPSNWSVVANLSLGPLATSHATGMCYDPDNHEMIVTEEGGTNRGRVSIIDTVTNTVQRTVLVGGTTPRNCLFDPVTSTVLITDYGSNDVAILNDSDVIIGHISVGQGPFDLTWDSRNQTVFVLCAGDWSRTWHPGGIVAIDGRTLSVTASISLGNSSAPSGIAYDAIHDRVYAANNWEAWAFNASTFAFEANFQYGHFVLGGFPVTASFNPGTGELYVGGAAVLIINSSSDRFAGSFAFVAAYTYGFDVSTSGHYLLAAGDGYLYHVDTSNGHVRATSIAGANEDVATNF